MSLYFSTELPIHSKFHCNRNDKVRFMGKGLYVPVLSHKLGQSGLRTSCNNSLMYQLLVQGLDAPERSRIKYVSM